MCKSPGVEATWDLKETERWMWQENRDQGATIQQCKWRDRQGSFLAHPYGLCRLFCPLSKRIFSKDGGWYNVIYIYKKILRLAGPIMDGRGGKEIWGGQLGGHDVSIFKFSAVAAKPSHDCSIKILRVLGRAIRQKAKIELIIVSNDGAKINLALVAWMRGRIFSSERGLCQEIVSQKVTKWVRRRALLRGTHLSSTGGCKWWLRASELLPRGFLAALVWRMLFICSS